jgi:hypothetical protein
MAKRIGLFVTNRQFSSGHFSIRELAEVPRRRRLLDDFGPNILYSTIKNFFSSSLKTSQSKLERMGQFHQHFLHQRPSIFVQIIFDDFNGCGIWQKCAKIWCSVQKL